MSLHDGMRKVTAEHTKKLACVYARQSTLRGIKENIVGWQRQLEEAIKLALELGWLREDIRVFDEDHQPRSGTTTEGRYGYVEMLDDVIEGRVGAVLSIEPARVGRDSADWHVLIKMCALTGTLVIDPHGIYDPNDPNDNTKMKFDALFVEVELRWITQRLQGAKLAVAEKGELRFFLPLGYVYDEDKKVILDPNEDVQKIVRLAFSLLKQLGSANRVAWYFKEKGLKFPTLVRSGPRAGQYDWNLLRVPRLLVMLHNPAYAGTYVYGRSKTRRKVIKKEGQAPTVVKYQERLKKEDWQFVLHDAHPAYITWSEFLEIEQRLSNNLRRRHGHATGAPREGAALLQGLTICGKCGHSMYISYSSNPYYICNYDKLQFAGKTCQTMPSDRIDYAVEQAFLDALKPAQIEMSLKALEQPEKQAHEADRQWGSRLRHAEAAVAEASERLLATDYRNKRAYARVQEHVENKEAELAALKRERAEEEKFALKKLTPQERKAILSIAQDFPLVWSAKTTDMVTKKNLLRCLIADVTITREGLTAHVGIRWKTQAHMPLTVELLGRRSQHRLPIRVLEFIKKLASHYTDRQIAAALNDAGFMNGRSKPFTWKRVKVIRQRYEIKKHPLDCSPDQRDDGRYNSIAIARMVRVHPNTVGRWCKQGRMDGVKGTPGRCWWVRTTPEELVEFEKAIRRCSLPCGKSE